MVQGQLKTRFLDLHHLTVKLSFWFHTKSQCPHRGGYEVRAQGHESTRTQEQLKPRFLSLHLIDQSCNSARFRKVCIISFDL